MTPTLAGRLQTRLALSLVIGMPVAVLAALLLDLLSAGDALRGLGVITTLGLLWDVIHQALQERRWDRDWPRLFTLLSWAPEAAASWLVLHLLAAAAPIGTHLAFFTMVWGSLLVARSAVLPVLLPRWRHAGQRLLLPASQPTATGSATDSPAEATAVAAAPRRNGFSGLFPGLQPAQQRLATLVLFAGVVGSVLLLAPLLDREPTAPAALDPRLANGEGYLPETPTGTLHRHEDGTRHHHGAADRPAYDGAVQRSWNTSERLRPSYVEFPGARVATRLQQTEMSATGVLASPSESQAAWFGQGAAPGQRGPAVLIGSVETVFAGLERARPGQSLHVVRSDGSRINFTVDKVTDVDARDFPTQKVYGADEDPLLRLVGYDTGSGRNRIVFAHAVSMVESPAEG